MSKPIHWSNQHLELLAKWQYYNRIIGLQQIIYVKAKEVGNEAKAKKISEAMTSALQVYSHIQMEIPKKFDEDNLAILIHCPVFKKYATPTIASFGERYVVLESLKQLSKERRKPSLLGQLRWWPANFGKEQNYLAWQIQVQEALGVTKVNAKTKVEITEILNTIPHE